MRLTFFAVTAIAFAGLAACTPIEQRPTLSAQDSAALAKGQSSLFEKGEMPLMDFAGIRYNIRRGETIGMDLDRIFECLPARGRGTQSIVWTGPRAIGGDEEELDLSEALTEAGFNLASNPRTIFGNAERKPVALQVGVTIEKIDIQLCRGFYLFTDRLNGYESGTATVRAKWEIYSNAERRVIYSKSFEGNGNLQHQVTRGQGMILLLLSALKDSAYRLAADEEFYNAVVAEPDRKRQTVQALDKEVIAVHKAQLLRGTLTNNIDRVRAASVLVEVGESHGSGFFISENGWLLTNEHVVGDNKFVRIQLVTGRTVVGEVVRLHKARDVALVKVEGQGYQFLPIRDEAVKVSEEVYAVGAPKDKRLATTVTKGIVSAYRPAFIRDLDIIQADVDIHGGNSGGPLVDASGNVVGISTFGLYMQQQKISSGLNGFVPILDALDKLRIRMDGARVSLN